jgi:hypothetical protein
VSYHLILAVEGAPLEVTVHDSVEALIGYTRTRDLADTQCWVFEGTSLPVVGTPPFLYLAHSPVGPVALFGIPGPEDNPSLETEYQNVTPVFVTPPVE